MPEENFYEQPGQQLALKFVRPDFINEDIIEPPQRIYRFDDRGNRYYYVLDDINYPTFGGSVTSIIKAIMGTPKPVTEKRIQMGDAAFFEYVENRRQFGTFMHIEWGQLGIHGEYQYGPQGADLKERIAQYAEANNVAYTGKKYGKPSWFTSAWKGMLSFAQFLEDYDVKVIAVELPLMDPSGYANTIDLWVDMYKKKYTSKTDPEDRKRVQALIDLKTGYFYDSHPIQLAFNRRSVVSNYSEKAEKIERLYNWRPKNWRSSPSYQLKNQTGKVEDKALDNYLWMWKNDPRSDYGLKPRDIKLPDGRVVVGSGFANNWQEVRIENFIQEKHNTV